MESATIDGRTARRLENRDRILDAALDQVADGVELTVEDIAERAGVSVRSVYNHFPTVRDLVAGMYERGTEKVAHLVQQLPSPREPFDHRLRKWVRIRGRILDEIAPVRWQALHAEDRHPGLQPELASLRKRHAADVRRTFPEICDPAARAAVIALTDSLCWRALRKHQNLSYERACDVIEKAIRRLAT